MHRLLFLAYIPALQFCKTSFSARVVLRFPAFWPAPHGGMWPPAQQAAPAPRHIAPQSCAGQNCWKYWGTTPPHCAEGKIIHQHHAQTLVRAQAQRIAHRRNARHGLGPHHLPGYGIMPHALPLWRWGGVFQIIKIAKHIVAAPSLCGIGGFLRNISCL